MFLDEFAADLPGGRAGGRRRGGRAGGAALRADLPRLRRRLGRPARRRARRLRVGLERRAPRSSSGPRLGAYLEQSTRYIAYDAADADAARRLPLLPRCGAGPGVRAGDGCACSTSTRRSLPRLIEWAAGAFPRADGEPEAAHARAIKAKALDLLRGLLPAASLSHMGIFASGQAYEGLILHLLAHPLPEAREIGTMILQEIQAVMPSFVARVERPERGGEWIEYLRCAGRRRRALVSPAGHRCARRRPAGRRCGCCGSTAMRTICSPRCCSSTARRPRRRCGTRSRGSAESERAAMLGDLVGERRNRRHRPGRGFEALRYRFEIVSDYGAFRDLQRHRMLTVAVAAAQPGPGRRHTRAGGSGRAGRCVPARARDLRG